MLLSEKESRALLEACLAELSVKEKLFVRLYYDDGFEMARIGKLLRMSESGVYAIKSRVAEKLREKIGKRGATA